LLQQAANCDAGPMPPDRTMLAAARNPLTHELHRWARILRRQRHPEEPVMPIPKHVFDPPFNIVRSSHIALGVADLGRARAF